MSIAMNIDWKESRENFAYIKTWLREEDNDEGAREHNIKHQQ